MKPYCSIKTSIVFIFCFVAGLFAQAPIDITGYWNSNEGQVFLVEDQQGKLGYQLFGTDQRIELNPFTAAEGGGENYYQANGYLFFATPTAMGIANLTNPQDTKAWMRIDANQAQEYIASPHPFEIAGRQASAPSGSLTSVNPTAPSLADQQQSKMNTVGRYLLFLGFGVGKGGDYWGDNKSSPSSLSFVADLALADNFTAGFEGAYSDG